MLFLSLNCTLCVNLFGGSATTPPTPTSQGIQWSSRYLMILAASSASGFVQWRLAKIKTADASLIWNKKPPDFRIRRSSVIKVLILIFSENGPQSWIFHAQNSPYTKFHVVWTVRSRVIKLWKFRIHFVQNLLLQVKYSKRCNSWSSCPKNTKLWVQTLVQTNLSTILSIMGFIVAKVHSSACQYLDSLAISAIQDSPLEVWHACRISL
jgi:hypothetical protein